MGTLVIGLPDESRFKKAIAGVKVGTKETLLSLIFDQLNIIRWQNTRDGQKGRRAPEPLTQILMYGEDKNKKNIKHRAVDVEQFNKEFYGKEVNNGR